MAVTGTAREDGQTLLHAFDDFGPVLAIKLYRLNRVDAPDVPIIPCLDHEAMLHEHVAAHAAAYVQETASGDLHEIVFIPSARRLEIDTVSTWGEHSPESRGRLIDLLKTRLPNYRLEVTGPSWWRGERRVANACLAQVSLRDVLLSPDTAAVRAGIERLQAVAGLMEKQSRVGSWGVRTATGPLLAAAGAVSYLILGEFRESLGETALMILRYGIIGALGAAFLYYGLKAVQLTEMSNRVWKRTAEYNLILAERKRLGR
ncbi:MAG TPA: hypothetical protein VFD21_07920 [Vicinamibacterales bacterium]|jgi:hypothetical protein|nr:hypothetical protein [Vicinamibacterales bacterium]